MLPQCSHKHARRVTRKRGVYYFRRRWPGEDGGEVALSLQTRNFRAAEWLAAALDREFDRMADTMGKDRLAVAEALRRFLKDMLADDERQWLAAEPGQPVYAWDAEDDEDPVAADLVAIERDVRDARQDAARRNFVAVADAADEVVAAHGLSPDDHAAVCLGILQARVKVYEARRERALGNSPGLEQEVSPVAPPPAAPTEAPPAGPKFSEVLPRLIDHGKTVKRWRGQTLAQNEVTFRLFREVCEDKPVTAYSRKDTGKFYDTLRALPAMWGKDKRWRGKGLAEIVESTRDLPESERLTMKTVKRHFSALGVFFAYAKGRGLIDGENPAYDFEFPSNRAGPKERDVWSDAMLTKLFASPVWTGRHATFRSKPGEHVIRDAFYWLPILGLHHGNRLEEFAQLLRRDIAQEDGIWFFDLVDDAGRKLKNKQSRRRVPIHPVIVGMGFLDHIEVVAPNLDDPVFPDLEPGGLDLRRGFAFTKRWTEYRRNVGVYDKSQDYHALRHTVITRLAALEVSQDIREAIAGHAGSGVNARVYRKGSRMPLAVLHAALSKLDWSGVSPLFAL